MQSTWGPRIFWAVVFLLVVAGVYAFFYEPRPELDRVGSARSADNLLVISPRLAGFELQLGVKDQVPTDWTGRVVVGGGKVVQLTPVTRTPNWNWTGDLFRLTTARIDKEVEPALVHIVAEGGESLHVTLNDETKAIQLAELTPGKSVDLFDGKASVRRTGPVQAYGHDQPTDDVAPRVAQDAAGNAFLVYLSCTKNKGLEVNALAAGSFDSLEKPVSSMAFRLSRFVKGSWQYAEQIGEKLETALDPVAVVAGGKLFVAWSQQGAEGWDIYYMFRDLSDTGEFLLSWSLPQKLTEKPGAHQDLVAVADAKGRAWLAWQTWHHDHHEIYAAVLNDTRHAWTKPGPVAEHSRDEEGRWNPALAADGQGHVYVAWSVFRGGHFDVALTRLGDNSALAPPIYVAASERQEQRPSLVCDAEHNLWIAYEASEAEPEGVAAFGAAVLPATQIHVRVLKPGKAGTEPRFLQESEFHEVPPVPRPLRRSGETVPVACRRPRVVLTKSGGVVVCYEVQRRLYVTRLQNPSWAEPEELVTLPAGSVNPATIAHQDEQLCVYFEGADPAGHARICLATRAEPAAAAPSVRPTPVAAEALRAKERPEWKRFAEMARHFRQRPEDLVLFKKYLLRGLLLSEPSARALGAEAWALTQSALEQGLYDWIAVPRSANAAPGMQGQLAGRALALSFGERRVLTGFLRPMTGQRQANFILENRPLDAPLPSLSWLQLLHGDLRGAGFGSQAMDQSMLSQYLVQSQSVGLLLTDDWRLLAAMNKPTAGSAFADPTENVVIPFWYPGAEPSRPAPPGVRVVAYAAGKSTEDLLDALRERRFYIATDDIHVLARCDRRTPGETFQTSFKPQINVVVKGTSKIARVEVWMDDKVVKQDEPPGAVSVVEYENANPDNAWHSYTIRVVQADGATAVTQPFWIRYLP